MIMIKPRVDGTNLSSWRSFMLLHPICNFKGAMYSRLCLSLKIPVLKGFLGVAAVVAIFGLESPGAARPWIYLSTWSYSGSAEKCLGQAKAALVKQGFTEELEVAYSKDRKFGGHVEGVLPGSPVRAKIDCNKTEGITGLAVSGLDNDLTYSKYEKLFDAQW